MTIPQNPTLVIESWTEAEWERLLLLVECSAVIPIVGAELSLGAGTEENAPIQKLARELAQQLEISAEQLPADDPLNEIAYRLARQGRSAQDLYLEIYRLLHKSPIAPTEPLRQLAQITDFQLFITTAFDTAIETAIRDARETETLSLSYAPNDVQDLPGARKSLTLPVVYHLLGKVAVSPSYVVTEEDTLEFFHALLSPQRRPERLFAEL